MPVKGMDHDVAQAPHTAVCAKKMVNPVCISVLDALAILGHPIGPPLLPVPLEQFAECISCSEKLGACSL